MPLEARSELDSLLAANKELTDMRFRHIETESIFMENERLRRENEELKLCLEQDTRLEDNNEQAFLHTLAQSVADSVADRNEIKELLQLQVQAVESGA